MYTPYQRFIATILLCGLLLQNCSSASLELTEEETAQHIVQANKPKQLNRYKPVASVHKYGSALASECASGGEPLYGLPSETPRASCVAMATVHGRLGTRSVVPSEHTSFPCQFSRSSTGHQKLPCRALDPRVNSLLGDSQLTNVHLSYPVASNMPTALAEAMQFPTQASIPLRQDAASLQSTSQTMASLRVSMGPFALSSGKTVVFSQIDGRWSARVKEIWGTFSREILLPVVCQEDLLVVLYNLEGKEAIHTRSYLHILETGQVPKAPRCVYVGYLGLRGGMEQETEKAQERITTVHAPDVTNRVAASVQGFQRHEKVDQDKNTQVLPSHAAPTSWQPPFVAREASILPDWFQDHLRLHSVLSSPASGASETSSSFHVPAVHSNVASESEPEEEITKMPSLPRVTTFTTPTAAREAVSVYLERWRLETPAGRVAILERGKILLKGVEALKKTTKRSYRRQVLSFEVHDIDPMVWNRILQQQQATKEQLCVLRGLRTQLLDACQFQELVTAGIRTVTNADSGEVELCSSDEETQQLSDQSRRNRAAFVAGIGRVLRGRIGELLTLLDDAMGTNIAPYVALLASTPELPELLEDYVDAFLQETDEERRAELLGALITEVIFQLFPLPPKKKKQLNSIKRKLGQAAHKIVLHRINQTKNSSEE